MGGDNVLYRESIGNGGWEKFDAFFGNLINDYKLNSNDMV